MPDKKDSYQPGSQQPAPAPATPGTSSILYPGEGHKPPSQESIDLLIRLLQELERRSGGTGTIPPEVQKDIAVVLAAFDAIKSALGLAETPIVVAGVKPNVGLATGGTKTTISGSDFLPGATVRFGAHAAKDVNVASLTEIQATTPAGAPGAVDVVVDSVAGSASLPGGYTYQASTQVPR